MIVLMVIVGGATRLTGSGLSITEWAPVSGVLPPMNSDAWSEAFAAYQASPQFVLENRHFDVTDFKAIYWWEWAHRLLGRSLGLILAVPLLALGGTGRLAPWVKRRALLLVVLIGFQGFLGWFMVSSGLVDEPRVSHFRLAAHLMTALLTLCVALWSALAVRGGHRRLPAAPRLLLAFGVALLLQITWGALVAGLNAGIYFPSWPKMGDQWIPPGVFNRGVLESIIHSPIAVQLVHRTLGAALVPLGLWAAWQAHRRKAPAAAVAVFATCLIGQFSLGVATILKFYMHPVTMGVSHQAGAVALLTATVVLTFTQSPKRH